MQTTKQSLFQVTLTGIVCCAIALSMSGCDEPVYEDESRAANTEPAEQPAQTRGSGGGGSGSALGPAKRSAEGLRDRVGQQQRNLEKQVEDMD